jgi:hypothetical protein
LNQTRWSRPDSLLAREAEAAAQDLLTPTLLNHSRGGYAWGAAIAALDEVEFDHELLYVAAMFHDTGLPSPIPASTSRSAARHWRATSLTATTYQRYNASS